jgi:hypothetical protein
MISALLYSILLFVAFLLTEISNWYYAPYRCKYHMYTNESAHQCLAALGIEHFHFQGDSISRDLFVAMSKRLNVARMTESELKHLTNVLKQNNFTVRSQSTGLILSEGYNWDWDPKILELAHESLADVVTSNYAFAHRHGPTFVVEHKYLDTEYAYWQNHLSSAKPKYKFHQGAKDVHGKKQFDLWGPEGFRSMDTMLKKHFKSQGFMYIDEYLITAGRIDGYATRGDGWHFFGSMRAMESEVVLNMLCNDWYQQQQRQQKSRRMRQRRI